MPSFYQDPNYKRKQSLITRENWRLGIYAFRIKPLVADVCLNPKCRKRFYVKLRDLKNRKYCSRSCAAKINNPGRIMSETTKLKISRALKGRPQKFLRVPIPPVEVLCKNPLCQKTMMLLPWLARRRKYCSNACAMKVIGGKTTSPKASKGISGIRKDVDLNICFYSTWEANMARVYNLVGIKWLYAPKIFNLKEHTYRPDFYLPNFDTYVEVKNYLGDYSLKRDQVFRKIYPNIKLELILKNDYLEIKSNYKYFIRNWEF